MSAERCNSQSQHQTLFARAVQHLRRDEDESAEILLLSLLDIIPNEPDALGMIGFIRYRQRRFIEAADFPMRSLRARPNQPVVQLSFAYSLREQGKIDEAEAAFVAAIALRPDLLEPHLALAGMLHNAGRIIDAEESYRNVLALSAEHVLAKLGLSGVLIDAKRPAEAEALARSARLETDDSRLVARLELLLGIAVGLQGRLEEEISCYQRAQVADPSLVHLEHRQACLLMNLGRYKEAVILFRQLLMREPLNLAVHQDYNNLLYCLGRDTEFLRSYDEAARRVPIATSLLLAKAPFLMFSQRFEEAYELYERALAQDTENLDAAIGAALALSHMKRFERALDMLYAIVSHHPGRANLYGDIALIAAQMGEPRKAATMAEQGLAANPHDQFCLALLGTSYRMMEDAREEWLNGYSNLIRVFDLDPPDGYADMTAFNTELNTYLDRLHPLKREFVNQSLRGGTQTSNNIFEGGHELIERLRVRIDTAVQRYIGEMENDERHPFLRRRSKDFYYSGAWSSRLRDKGFHVNHVHTAGWISSCYYVGVPDVAFDAKAKQGWLKFGEPRFDVALTEPIARTVQPVAGRLVLFPSYTWHGTIPFRSAATRTTIAFDVIPT